jgi:uncharacterized repeat protein (TIGR03847 family)
MRRMAEYLYDLDGVQRITVGTVGPRGRRVFYLQARRDRTLVSVIAEKEQIRELASAIIRLLDGLAERNPRLSTSDDLLIADMNLEEPIEPLFRIGQMGLGYDSDRDQVVVLVQALTAAAADDTDDNDDDDDDDAGAAAVRLAASRPQMRALADHAEQIVAAGRPICGNCGKPIDPSGHFCPHRNGHGPVYR